MNNPEALLNAINNIDVQENDIKLVEAKFFTNDSLRLAKILKFFGIKDDYSLKFFYSLNQSIITFICIPYNVKFNIKDFKLYMKPKANYKTKYPILAFNIDCKSLKIYEEFFFEFNQILHEIDFLYPKNFHNKLYRASLKFREILPEIDNRHFSSWIEFENYINSDNSFKELNNIILKKWKIIKNIKTRKRKSKILTEMIDNFVYSSELTAQITDDENNKIDFFTFEQGNSKNKFLDEDEVTLKEEISYIDSKRGKFKRNIRKFVVSSEIQKHYIHHFYDKNSININLFEKLLKKSFNHPVAALLVLSALTGIKWEDLIKILKNEHKEIKLFETLKLYYYKYPFEVHNISHEFNDILKLNDYSNNIIVCFPEFIHILVKYLNMNLNYNFSKRNIKNFIKNNLNYAYNFQITSDRIANFLFFYLVERFGLSLIYASCISSKFQYVFTQIRYTRINFIRMYVRYSLCLENLFDVLNFSFNRSSDYFPFEKAYFMKGYGISKIVPNKLYIQNFFKDIISFINNLPKKNFEEKVSKLNYVNLYFYFLIQLLTGHRPINNFNYNFSNLSFNPPFIIIMDKLSDKFSEVRYVPLCNFLKKQLKEIIAKLEELYLISKTRADTFEININNFFAIYNQRKKEVSYTFENIRALLKPVTQNPILDLPKNLFRHYFKSYLFNNNVNEKLIDALMGHVRYGNEIFNIFSTVQIDKFTKNVYEIQEKILNEIEITQIIKI